MPRVAVLLVVVVLVGLVIWWGLTELQDPTPSEGEAVAARDAPEEEAQASLVGRPVEASGVAPERVQGPGSIHGPVHAGQKGVPVRVEVRPVRSAEGRYGGLLAAPPSEVPPLAVADVLTGEGFEIPDLPVGAYEVSAHAPGVGWARAHVYCRPTQPRAYVLLHLLGGEASLVGRAIHADGPPFAGLVFAMPSSSGGWGGSAFPSVSTDPEGRFTLEALPAGEVAVVFLRPGKLRSTFAAVPVPQTSERVFVVDGDLVAIEGRVIADDTEEPLQGARIEVDSRIRELRRGIVTHVESGPGGEFVLRLPAKAGGLSCVADGFEPVHYSIDEEKDLVLRLKRRGIVTGIVVRKDDGTPLEGVAVRGWNWHTFGMADPLATSDAEGRFRCEAGPGKGMIYVLHRGWVSHDLTDYGTRDVNPNYIAVGQGETQDVRLEAVRAAHVDGVVRTSGGEPVANVHLTLTLVDRRAFAGFVHSELFSTSTDSRGRYELRPVVPGHAVQVQATLPSGIQAQSESFTLEVGEHRTIDLQIDEPRSLQIRVINGQTGAAVFQAHVSGRQGRHGVGATTSTDGRATLFPLQMQPVTLEVRHPDFIAVGGGVPGMHGAERWLPIAAFAEEEVEVELTPGFRVSGRILNQDGSPYLGGGGIGIHAVGELPGAGFGLVGRQMHPKAVEFELGPVPAGTYDLILVTNGHHDPDFLGRWTVEAGQRDLQLRLDPEAAEAAKEDVVTFRVHGPAGKPACGWIRISSNDGRSQEFGSVYKGEYRVTRIRPNTSVWVHIWGREARGAEALGSLLRGPLLLAPGVVELTLDAPMTLEGRLLDPQGRGIRGSLITAEPVYPPEAPRLSRHPFLPSVRTEEDGRFAIPNLTNIEYRLFVGTPTEFALVPPYVARPGTDVEIRLVAGLGVDLVVRGPDGEPVGGAAVEVTLVGRDRSKREASTDAQGKARIEGLAAGASYALIVKPPDADLDLVDHRIDPWFPAGLEVALRRGRALDVEVRRGSAPVSFARIWWRVGEEPWRGEQAAAGGSLRLLVPVGEPVELRAGEAQLSDASSGGPPVVTAPETGHVLLVLK